MTITIYQWRATPAKPWGFCCYVPDAATPAMLKTLCADGVGGEARAITFRRKSVADLRKDGWIPKIPVATKGCW